MENKQIIKIAVIDTSIDTKDEDLRGYYEIIPEIQVNEIVYNNDEHGTLVCKTIVDICKDVLIYPINIFENDGCTSSLKLLQALKKLLDYDVKLINISASTINQKYRNDICEVCDRLTQQGKIILSAKHRYDEENMCIPATFESVIGVDGNDNIYNNDEYTYNKNEKIQMCVNTKEIFIKYKDGVTHFGKSSKGCAIATGIVANILKKNNNLSYYEMEKELISDAVLELKDSYIKRIKKVMLNELKKNKLNNMSNISEVTGVNNLDYKIEYIEYGIKKVMKENFNNISNLDNIRNMNIIYDCALVRRDNISILIEKINEFFRIEIDCLDFLLEEISDFELLKLIIYVHLYCNV